MCSCQRTQSKNSGTVRTTKRISSALQADDIRTVNQLRDASRARSLIQPRCLFLLHSIVPTFAGDLWGPLLLCLLLASTLSISASSKQSALIFAAVFVLVWVGAGIITLNAALLGGQISFLQSVCVLGYCIAPLNLASILCHAWANKIYHFVLVMVAFVWATRASVGFMAQLVAENKRALAVYPVLLFYLAIAWMILVQ